MEGEGKCIVICSVPGLNDLALLPVQSFGLMRRECSGMKLTLLSYTCIWKFHVGILQWVLIQCQKHIDCNGKGCGWGGISWNFHLECVKVQSPNYWLMCKYWRYTLKPVIVHFPFAGNMHSVFLTKKEKMFAMEAIVLPVLSLFRIMLCMHLYIEACRAG